MSYSVDVLSLKLQRANGAQVETLPQTTRVDFAQLTDLSDLLSVASLAPGDFVKGSIRIDYTNADIEVQKGTDSVKATAVDGSGKPLGVTELEIRLDGRDHLVITKGRAAFLAVDFNLAASNTVDLTQTTPVVTVQPFIVASVQPVADKDLRVRGPLVSVDTAASSYVVNVRPWFLASGDHGQLTVHTSSATSFEIDGTASTGADGLKALAAETTGTLTLAIGTLDTSTRDFTADTVLAGTSVPGEGLDAVQGNVVSRSGDTLTVKGAFAVHHDHQLDFQRTVIVTIGANTKVTKAGSTAAVDASAISVGQSIVALGTLSEAASSGGTMGPTPAASTTPATLDATAGRVRLQPTELHGAVKSVVAGTLTLQLRSIDRLGIAMFNFAGTGTATASDADPNNYEVQTGNLSLANLSAGEAAKVIGFVTPFGSAPPDFVGTTVVDHLDLPSTLGIGWGATGTTAPFVSMNRDGPRDRHHEQEHRRSALHPLRDAEAGHPDARVGSDDRADDGSRHVRRLGARPRRAVRALRGLRDEARGAARGRRRGHVDDRVRRLRRGQQRADGERRLGVLREGRRGVGRQPGLTVRTAR